MKNLAKKLSLLLLSALLILSFASGIALSAAAEENIELIVLYTNDVHCGIEGYSVLAAYRAELISQGHEVVTVDAGDAIQGEMIGTLTEGGAVVDIMNTVGYDYAAVGNHEFDYTVPRLLEIYESEAEYEYICANFRDLVNEKDVFAPYVIKEAGGERIAFVGISTPETYSKSTPTYFQDENGNFIYSFMEDDFYVTIQKAVDNALSAGATRVIAVGHLGVSGVTEGWRSVDVIANTIGLDAFIDAHAHEVIEGDIYKDKDGNEVVLSSTGTKLNNFGKMTLYSDGSIETELIDPDTVNIDELSESAKTAYNTVKEKVDAYNAEFEYLFEVIGASDVYLTVNDSDGNRLVRNGETNLGDFVTDAYRAVTGADIAFVNGGGVRAEINIGEVTRKEIMDVNPWGNEMCVIEISGQQLLDALEYGSNAYPQEFGSFPQVSGVCFEVHTYVESPVVVNELGDFVSIKENAPRRIRNVLVGGKALDVNKTYTLAGTRYMLQLSGYKMLDGAKELEYNGPLTDAEMLIEYFAEHLNGKITAEQYSDIGGEGRIMMINSAPDTSEDIPAGDGTVHILWISLIVLASVSAMAICKKRI